MEYLIIIAAVLIVASVVTVLVTGAVGTQREDVLIEQCRSAAAQCSLRRAANPNDPCNFCIDACEPVEEEGLAENAIQCCQRGMEDQIYLGADGLACLEVETYTLTVDTVGQGSTDPSGTTTYEEGESVTITQSSASGWEFSHWSGAECDGSTSSTCTVTMNNHKTVAAHFEEDQEAEGEEFDLGCRSTGSISCDGGTCDSDVECSWDDTCGSECPDVDGAIRLSDSCSSGRDVYESCGCRDDMINGGDIGVCHGSASCSVSGRCNYQCVEEGYVYDAGEQRCVEESDKYQFTLSNCEQEGSIFCAGGVCDSSEECSWDSTCDASCPEIENANIIGEGCSSSYQATQDCTCVAGLGPDGDDWCHGMASCTASGECTYECEEEGQYYDSDLGKCVEDAHELTINIQGNGETTPSEGTHYYEEGSSVSISHHAAIGWEFSHWSGAECDGSTSSTCTVTMDEDKTVTAHFEEEEVGEEFTLSNCEQEGSIFCAGGVCDSSEECSWDSTCDASCPEIENAEIINDGCSSSYQVSEDCTCDQVPNADWYSCRGIASCTTSGTCTYQCNPGYVYDSELGECVEDPCGGCPDDQICCDCGDGVYMCMSSADCPGMCPS